MVTYFLVDPEGHHQILDFSGFQKFLLRLEEHFLVSFFPLRAVDEFADFSDEYYFGDSIGF